MAEDLLEDEVDEYIKEDASDAPEKNGKGSGGKLAALKGMLASRKKLILIVAGVVIFALVGTGALLLFFGGSGEELPDETAGQPAAEIQAGLEAEEEVVFEDIVMLEPFERIRLKASSPMALASFTLALELTDHRYRRQMIAMQERIRKIVIAEMGQRGWVELRSPEGKLALKYELLKRINESFPKVAVRNVYFTDFLMQ